MAVSFSISNITSSSFRVNITGTNSSTYRYIRIFAKETSSGETVHDNKWIDSRGSSLSDNITGLSADTSYTVNVSYNSTNSATGSTWVGGQTVTTKSSGGGGSETVTYWYYFRYQLSNGTYISSSAPFSKSNSAGRIVIPVSESSAPNGYGKSGTYGVYSGDASYDSSDRAWTVYDTSYPGAALSVTCYEISNTYYYYFRYELSDGTYIRSSGQYSKTSGAGRIEVPRSEASAPSGYEITGSYGVLNNSGATYNSSTGRWTVTSTSAPGAGLIVYCRPITYTADIIYYPNGAGGNSSYTQTVSGKSTTLSFTALVPAKCGFTVPTGRTFGGWGTSSSSISASYNAGTSYNINANGYLELYAIWEYTYEAKWYDLKAQSTPIRSDSYKTARSTWSFTAPSRSMTGYDFIGWYDSYSGNNGTGNLLVGAGEDINLPYKNSRSWYLYARWLVHTYNISFNANGGSGTMNSITNCTYGTDYTLPKNQFTRNYTITLNYNYDNKKVAKNAECPFLYWSYNNKTYKDQATVKNLADSGTATLYAQWGNYSVELPTLIRSGYVFLGWFTSATGGSQVNSPATGMSDRTLYAHWKEDVISPTISNVSHTDTDITISLNRNNATTGSWVIEASLSNFGTVVYTKTITSTTQTTITLTGLTPETTYYIRARHVNGGVSASSNVISATTRTSTFQWTSNDSVYVIKSAVFTDAITAAKWNELIKKVNWCRGRKGWPTASLNSAVSGQPILATNFTAMRNAIADMHPVTPARSAGDEILATYFANSDTSLKSAINAVITTL